MSSHNPSSSSNDALNGPNAQTETTSPSHYPFPQISVPLSTIHGAYLPYSMTCSSSASSLDEKHSAPATSDSTPSSTTLASSTLSQTAEGSNHTCPNFHTSFHAFSELVPEIQDLVWRFALPPPRLISLRYRRSSRNQETQSSASMNRPTALLSVCRAARHVALRYYSPLFPGDQSCAHLIPRNTYFDPFSDTVYFPGHWQSLPASEASSTSQMAAFTQFTTIVNLLSPSTTTQIRNIAVHSNVFLGDPGRWINQILADSHLRWFWWHILEKFPSLQELTITDYEETALEDFGPERRWEKDDPKAIHSPETDASVGSTVNKSDLSLNVRDTRHETLYDITLRTYWNLRKHQPSWKPPRWRVWQSTKPRSL